METRRISKWAYAIYVFFIVSTLYMLRLEWQLLILLDSDESRYTDWSALVMSTGYTVSVMLSILLRPRVRILPSSDTKPADCAPVDAPSEGILSWEMPVRPRFRRTDIVIVAVLLQTWHIELALLLLGTYLLLGAYLDFRHPKWLWGRYRTWMTQTGTEQSFAYLAGYWTLSVIVPSMCVLAVLGDFSGFEHMMFLTYIQSFVWIGILFIAYVPWLLGRYAAEWFQRVFGS